MLLNLHKKTWMDGLSLQDYNEHCKLNEGTVNDMLELAKHYNKVSNHSITKLLFVIIMYKLSNYSCKNSRGKLLNCHYTYHLYVQRLLKYLNLPSGKINQGLLILTNVVLKLKLFNCSCNMSNM